MGMFDTLLVKARCPYYKEIHNDLQTKSFVNFLDEYKIGDFIEGSPIESGVLKRAAYDYCKKAGKLIHVDIKIKKYKLSGVGKAVTEELYQKEQKEIERKIKQSKRYKDKIKQMRQGMRSFLKMAKKWKIKKRRPTVFINLQTKEKPELMVLNKNGIYQKAKLKKFAKDKIILEFLK